MSGGTKRVTSPAPAFTEAAEQRRAARWRLQSAYTVAGDFWLAGSFRKNGKFVTRRLSEQISSAVLQMRICLEVSDELGGFLKSIDHGFGRIGGEFDLDGPVIPCPLEQEIGLDPIGCPKKNRARRSKQRGPARRGVVRPRSPPNCNRPTADCRDARYFAHFDKALGEVTRPRTHTAYQKSLLQKLAISNDGLA